MDFPSAAVSRMQERQVMSSLAAKPWKGSQGLSFIALYSAAFFPIICANSGMQRREIKFRQITKMVKENEPYGVQMCA
jgi:hypothetical protein